MPPSHVLGTVLTPFIYDLIVCSQQPCLLKHSERLHGLPGVTQQVAESGPNTEILAASAGHTLTPVGSDRRGVIEIKDIKRVMK